ncbi:MAG: c-type cytochrome [Verrucomicrobia bacterium]|nr:c-type cytochrome [Verrucomicrobiota bacterium]
MRFGVSLAAESLDSPAAELASFQIADGFEVSLFASENNGVVKPIQIRFDARGRLWVIGSTVYPQIEPGETPNDKVLILEDTDGDGRADKTTVFADGLMIPTGLELGDGGAYVGHGTELLFLKDTNGDDRADDRRVLLRGFGTGDNHQNINSFRWGPGGELWFCQGLHTHSSVETPWGLVRLDQAGLWRLRPRLTKLEGFYGSQNEPQNPWGYVFTDWGEPIVIAGNNSSSIYPVPGLVSNHRDEPPALIWKNGNGRKSSGGEIVGTAHFPDAWQGVVILGGYINNAVWALKLSDDGAGFALEDLPPLIKSTSRSFRPVDAKFGPDGALYLCDWYNPIIGHYQASFRHPDRDKTHGRIWRVTAKGRPLTKPPQLADASIPTLLDHLQSSDRWTRQFAKRVLADRPTSEVTSTLKIWTTKSDLSEHALVEALGVYLSHEAPAAELLARLCSAKEPGARAYAASVVGAWATRLPDPLVLLRPLVVDENPRVRLQAVVACTYVAKPEAMAVAAIAADFPTDKFLDYALKQAVFALKPQWLPAFKAGQLNLENKPARLNLLIRADGTVDTLNALRELTTSTPLGDPRHETFFTLLADVGDANDLARLLDTKTFTGAKGHDAAQHARVLEALATSARARNIRPAGDVGGALTALSNNTPPDSLRVAMLHLATQWKVTAFNGAALYAFACTPDNDELRIAGANTLAALWPEEAPKLLGDLSRAGRVQGERVAAAIGFTSFDLPRAASVATDILAEDRDGRSIAQLLPPIFQRQGGAAALAEALAAKAPSRSAAEAAVRLMSASGRRDERLAKLFRDAAGFSRNGQTMTPAEFTTLAADIRTNGDAKHGEEIFRRAELGCIACHAVNGQGGNIGPNLSALGTAQPIDFIIGAILEPQKEIKEGFMSISVTTTDGEEYQGYQIRETKDELVLRDVLQNKEVRLRRGAIREKKQNGSVMPGGLADSLTHAEFRDLVRFLSELGKPTP